MPTCSGVCAKPVAIEAKPMPMKNTTIMPSRLHLSASQPAGQREQPEREEARRRVFQQTRHSCRPHSRVQRERRHGGEDQREQVVEEVPDVQKQEMTAVAIHGFRPRRLIPRNIALAESAPSCQDSSKFCHGRCSMSAQRKTRRSAPHRARDYQRRCRRPLAAMSKSFSDGFEIEPHHHKRDQLIYAVSGVMRVRTAHEAWIVPPDRAVYVPGGTDAFDQHARRGGDAHALHRAQLYAGRLPEQPTVMAVPDLLRELILALIAEPLLYDRAGTGRRDRGADPLRDRARAAPAAGDPDAARSAPAPRLHGAARRSIRPPHASRVGRRSRAPRRARWRGCSRTSLASPSRRGASACAFTTRWRPSRGTNRSSGSRPTTAIERGSAFSAAFRALMGHAPTAPRRAVSRAAANAFAAVVRYLSSTCESRSDGRASAPICVARLWGAALIMRRQPPPEG